MAAGDFVAGAALVAIGLYFEEMVVSMIGAGPAAVGHGGHGLDDRPGQPTDPALVTLRRLRRRRRRRGHRRPPAPHRPRGHAGRPRRPPRAIRRRGLTLDTYEATYVVDAPATDTVGRRVLDRRHRRRARREVPAQTEAALADLVRARARRDAGAHAPRTASPTRPRRCAGSPGPTAVLVMLPADAPRAGGRRPEVPPGAGDAGPRPGPLGHRRRRRAGGRRPAHRRLRVRGRGPTSWRGSTASCS